MSNTPQPTAEELLGHHLAYEINQMAAALNMLGKVTVPKELAPQQALDNALMESFYVHARVLFEFFKKSRGAQHYAVDGYKPLKGVNAADWIQRLNNQVSHLLDGRTADDSLKIDGKERIEIVNALHAEVEAFKKSLKPEFAGIAIPSVPLFMYVASAVPGATGTFGEIKGGK